MSCVHYKFSSKLNYDTVTFDGLHISLCDLKRQIMGREKLKAADCDLQITNAQTKEGRPGGRRAGTWRQRRLSGRRALRPPRLLPTPPGRSLCPRRLSRGFGGDGRRPCAGPWCRSGPRPASVRGACLPRAFRPGGMGVDRLAGYLCGRPSGTQDVTGQGTVSGRVCFFSPLLLLKKREICRKKNNESQGPPPDFGVCQE